MNKLTKYLELVNDAKRHIMIASKELNPGGFDSARDAYTFCMDVYGIMMRQYLNRCTSNGGRHMEDINLEHLMAFLDASVDIIDDIEEDSHYAVAIEKQLEDKEQPFRNLRSRLEEEDRLTRDIRSQRSWTRLPDEVEYAMQPDNFNRNGKLADEFFSEVSTFETTIDFGRYEGTTVGLSRYKRRKDAIERMPPGSLPAVLRRVGEVKVGYSITVSNLGLLEDGFDEPEEVVLPLVVVGKEAERYYELLSRATGA